MPPVGISLGENTPMANKQNDLISFPMHLPREVERMFDEMIHRPWGSCREMRGWNPSVDLYETADAYILEADLPGVSSDDFRVEIENSDWSCRAGAPWKRNTMTASFTPWSAHQATLAGASNFLNRSTKKLSTRSFATACCASSFLNQRRQAKKQPEPQ